jgi:hypothetical protein
LDNDPYPWSKTHRKLPATSGISTGQIQRATGGRPCETPAHRLLFRAVAPRIGVVFPRLKIAVSALRPSRIEGAPLRDAADWLEQYREVWEGRLDRLARHLEDIQGKAGRDE